MPAKLTLHDIADLREYERERDAFRRRIIALKAIRRVDLGPIISLTFENRETILFQIQEMARAEKMTKDAQIEEELAVYNPLIPGPGQLCATLFLELTSKEQLMEWLPKLVGIETSLEVVIDSPDGDIVVPCQVEESHEEQLTRPDVTASVHYIRFNLPDEAAAAMRRAKRVEILSTHHRYPYGTELSLDAIASLVADWD
ncbi:MAG: DUF3501 family protein [Actinomycetota bacterium]|nr:DUF3501 family protein [Actinomycetota bacterium]MDA8397971.1 DUF3501 family protein [Actinomycetota bacterium]